MLGTSQMRQNTFKYEQDCFFSLLLLSYAFYYININCNITVGSRYWHSHIILVSLHRAVSSFSSCNMFKLNL